jgi:hypothetical protein
MQARAQKAQERNPVLYYVAMGAGAALYLLHYCWGRLSNRMRVQIVADALRPALRRHFSAVALRAADSGTGFTPYTFLPWMTTGNTAFTASGRANRRSRTLLEFATSFASAVLRPI